METWQVVALVAAGAIVLWLVFGGSSLFSQERNTYAAARASCTKPTPPYPAYMEAYPQFYGAGAQCQTGSYALTDPYCYLRVLHQGTEMYPCNNCSQGYAKYGGSVPSETTQCGIVEKENHLLRTDKIYTRCRGLSTLDVVM